jgi:organic radical activating enzyme
VEAAAPGGANICFTGGEPFLQNADAFGELVVDLEARGYRTFEVFTNGTLEFPEWATDSLLFIMDWKLKGSGEEARIDSAVNAVRLKNVERLTEGDVVKFTIKDRDDFIEARSWYLMLHEKNPHVDFIYGVVWGTLDASELIKWVLADGDLVEWTYTHQLHNVIWNRSQRAI